MEKPPYVTTGTVGSCLQGAFHNALRYVLAQRPSTPGAV